MKRLGIFGLTLIATAVSGHAFAGERTAAEVNVVGKVTARADGAKTVITVHGTATPSFTAYRLERPARVVVDLAGSKLGESDGPVDVDTWAVGQIATAQYADERSKTARVMIGFKRASTYDVRALGHDVVITVTPDEAPPAGGPQAQDEARRKAEAARADAERARIEAERARHDAEAAQKQAERARQAEEERLLALRRARADAEKRTQKQLDAQHEAEEATRKAEAARREAEAARASAEAARTQLEELAKARRAEHARSGAEMEADVARLRAERTREQERLQALKAEADRLVTKRAEEARHLGETQAAARKLQLDRASRLEDARLAAEKRAEASEASRRAEERRLRSQAEQAERLAHAAQAARAAEQAREQADEAKSKSTQAAVEAERRAREAANAAASELKRVEMLRADARKLAIEAEKARADVARARAETERLQAVQAEERSRADRARAEALELQRARVEQAERAQIAAALASRERDKIDAAEREARKIAEERARESARLDEARQEAQALAERRQSELKKLDEARAEAQKLAQTRQAELDGLAAKRAREEAQLEAARHETVRLAAEVERLARAADAAGKDAQAARAQREEAAKETQAMRAQRDEVVKETAAIRKKREADARAAERIAEELARVETAKREALSAKQTAQAQADREAARLKSELAALEEERRAAQTALDRERQAARDAHEQNTAELSQAVSRLEAAKRAAQAAVERKRTEESEAARQAGRLAGEVERLENERRTAQAALESQRRAMESQKKVMESERQAMESQRDALKREHATLEQKLEQARIELERLKTEAQRRLAVVPTPARMAAPARMPTPPRVTAIAHIEDVVFSDDSEQERVTVSFTGSPAVTVLREGGHAVLRLGAATLDKGLERTLDASAFGGPVRSVSTYRDPTDPQAVRVVVSLNEEVEPKLDRDGMRLVWQFPRARATAQSHSYPPQRVGAFGASVPLQVASAPSFGGSSRRRVYSGRRIELDLNNADIHNVLRFLADIGDVNILATDDVKGTVTIRIKDVPWDQALEIIVKSKNLGMQRQGNVIRVAPSATLAKELEEEVARAKAAVELKPIETKLIQLSYADANQLQARVQEVMSPRGKVSIDTRTNMLIVSDVGGNIALAEDLVRNLDTQTPQVLIEARIVEARATFSREVGIQWGGNSINSQATGNPTGIAFPSTVGLAGGATDAVAPLGGLQLPGAASPNYAVNLPARVSTGLGGALGITLGSVNGNVNINLRLSASENTGQVRIVSAPKIMTLDNIEASIEQGVAIPISVVSAAGTNTVFIDAKLNLTVKPHVTAEGSIIMNVAITRNEPDFVNTGARGDPTILKKQARTEMLVRDGDTAVIGGIYTRNTGLAYTKVPWFAEIPLLGWLFKSKRENDDRTELLIFITPRIVNRATARR